MPLHRRNRPRLSPRRLHRSHPPQARHSTPMRSTHYKRTDNQPNLPAASRPSRVGFRRSARLARCAHASGGIRLPPET
ncbi:hypothetical protein AEM38_07395 [Hyphomonadaceae bacterium UKL13-1]|nr:hypothetical protein AEM38_07395 [Hyphomonadaceae bacterium UKL13-1]